MLDIKLSPVNPIILPDPEFEGLPTALTAIVKAEFPQSTFNAQHASWYRMQLKSGKLTGTKVAIPRRQKASAAVGSAF